MPTTALSHELVREFLCGRPTERPPILLHLGPYAARLQQSTYQQLAADPTLLANALQGGQRLFGCDALVILADATVEAEAWGCEVDWHEDEPVVVSHPLATTESSAQTVEGGERHGRLAVALEVAGRLQAVIGREVVLVPAVTGPVTLAALLRGAAFWADLETEPEQAYRVVEIAGQVTVRLARRYFDLGLEQLLLFDPELGRLEARHYGRVHAVLRALWNVADFYDVPVLLQTDILPSSSLDEVFGLEASGFVLTGKLPSEAFVGKAGLQGRRLFVEVPPEVLSATVLGNPGVAADEWLAEWSSMSSSGEVAPYCFLPRSAPPERVLEVLRVLRSGAGGFAAPGPVEQAGLRGGIY